LLFRRDLVGMCLTGIIYCGLLFIGRFSTGFFIADSFIIGLGVAFGMCCLLVTFVSFLISRLYTIFVSHF
jgi:hypothetical protein